MGNKNKTTKVINSKEDDIKPKIKKIKYVAQDSEITTDISELSKNIKSVKNVDRKKIKEEKSSIINDKEYNSQGKLEVDITDSFNEVVDQKISIKKKENKKKPKTDEEITNVVSPKVKLQTPDLELKKHLKPKNETTDMDGDSAAREKTVNQNKRKFLNEDEAEVKDEDIDKFCDELSEEDNYTYENWVKLFEANFRKNKNP